MLSPNAIAAILARITCGTLRLLALLLLLLLLLLRHRRGSCLRGTRYLCGWVLSILLLLRLQMLLCLLLYTRIHFAAPLRGRTANRGRIAFTIL